MFFDLLLMKWLKTVIITELVYTPCNNFILVSSLKTGLKAELIK